MNPLEQLKDIHLPQQISNWPPAIGWWLVALLIIVTVTLTIKWIKHRRSQRLAMRQALLQLKQVQHTDADWPLQLNSILKRLCISYFPQQDCASLYEKQWLNFLSDKLPAKKQKHFSDSYGLLLETLFSGSAHQLSFDTLQPIIKQWITTSLPPKKTKTVKKKQPETGEPQDV